MKTFTNINILLFIVYISIITLHTAHSFRLYDQKSIDQIAIEYYSLDDPSSSINEDESIEDPYLAQTHPVLAKRSADSAEKYFDWASKTNRPMEYLRGKRLWLFPKKDEHVNNHEKIPNAGPTAGIWRSGIVGRRRR